MSITINKEKAVIIGSGPAAYSAGVYLKEFHPLVLAGSDTESSQYPGGQLNTTTAVDNYPGFSGMQGPELSTLFKDHAVKEGARVKPIWATKITPTQDGILIHTREEGTIITEAVIIATGSYAKRLYVKGTGDTELWQKGISSCATCDGWIFYDKTVMVIGGGDTAMEEVLYLSSIAGKVILIHRTDKFRARADLLKKVESMEKVEIRRWTVLEEAYGEEKLEGVIVKNVKTQEKEEVKLDGLFFAIGHTPNTQLLSEANESLPGERKLLSKTRYVIANNQMETAVEGIFAAGDVQDSVYRQAVTAAYTGMVAGRSAANWLNKTK